MLASAMAIFTIIAPILFIAGLGVFWDKAGYKFDSEGFTPLILNLGIPCLIISIVPGLNVAHIDLLYMGFASFVVIFATLGVAYAFSRLMGYQAASMLPPLTFGNVGNMGLPLCLFAFGDIGLGYATAFFAVYMALQLILTPILTAGSFDLRQSLKIPSLYAVIFSFTLLLTGITLPKWLADGIELTGQITIPLMLLTLGISLARLKVGNMVQAGIASVARLAIGLAIGYCVVALLPINDPIARKVIIVQSAMPAAVFNYLFAVRYHRQPEEVAGVIVFSTVLSFAGIPILLWYLGF